MERYYSFERPLEYALSIQKAGAVIDKDKAAPDSTVKPIPGEPAPAEEAEAEKGEEAEKKTNFLPWLIVIILLAVLVFAVLWKYRRRV